MSLSPSISIDAVTNTGLMNLFNELSLFATYEFDDSEVTVSAVSTPTSIDFPIFEANVLLLEKWIVLIKENLKIIWESAGDFDSKIQTTSTGLTASYKLNQFLSNISFDKSDQEFTILPTPSQTISFTIFERWSKFLRRVNEDARLFG